MFSWITQFYNLLWSEVVFKLFTASTSQIPTNKNADLMIHIRMVALVNISVFQCELIYSGLLQ